MDTEPGSQGRLRQLGRTRQLGRPRHLGRPRLAIKAGLASTALAEAFERNMYTANVLSAKSTDECLQTKSQHNCQ